MNRNLTWCCFLIVFLTLSNPSVLFAKVESETWLGLPDSREEYIVEPVFQSKTYIYQAGIGNKQAVVLVHGLGQNGAKDWSQIIPVLAKKYHVLTFDLPGFGRSSKANRLYSPENYVRFIKFLVDKKLNRPFFLMGHSMGAAIAIRFAATHSEHVQRLVLVDAAGVLHRVAYTKFLSHYGLKLIPNVYPGQQRHLQNLVSDLIDRFARVNFPQDIILESEMTRQKFFDGDPIKIAGFSLLMDDFSKLIPNVSAPTLVLWGQQDEITPLRTGKVLAAKLPNAQLTIIPEAGHLVMKDSPIRFESEVMTYFNLNPVELDQIQKNVGLDKTTKVEINNKRDGHCFKQHNKVFEGNYDRITVKNCKNLLIVNSTASLVKIIDSSVEIENSQIQGDENAIQIKGSRLKVTTTDIRADDAIITDEHSRLDFAGADIVGEKSAVKLRLSGQESVEKPKSLNILFSISTIRSPNNYGRAHGPHQLTVNQPL